MKPSMVQEPVILVADDDEDIRVFVTMLLERAGYRVVAAKDGQEALKLAARHDPDLLLLDVSMPVMSGHEVCRAIVSDNPSPPAVIFLSARTRPADRVLGLEAGAVDYMTKPFDARELTTRVAVALRTRQRMSALERDSAVDHLTGLLNRSQLDIQLPKAVARTRRHGVELACIIVDIDGFKSINDELGHLAGDDVLREVSARLRGNARVEDSVYRWGGEEFCILVESDPRGAMVVAGKLLEAIMGEQINGITVTASAGVASWSPLFTQPTDLLEAADAALYEAKHCGRAQAKLWTDPSHSAPAPTIV